VAIELTNATQASDPAPDPGWGAAKRVGFRFVFSLFALCLFTRLLLAHAGMEAEFNPAAAMVQGLCARLWAPVIVWTGHHVLHVQSHLAYVANGNSDGIYGHVEWFAITMLAALAAMVWTLASRKPGSYARLLDGLRVALRYSLGIEMLWYGIFKLLLVQFSFPGLYVLRAPYGDLDPMGVLWTFMGCSSTYTIFAGAVEVVGGVPLFFRRSTTLGALITGGALVNVFMLDISYDVPEKLDVLWMLAATLFILWPDLRRLTHLLLLNNPVPAAGLIAPGHPTWMSKLNRVVKFLVIAYAVVLATLTASSFRVKYKTRSPLYGIYKVEEFTRNGQVLPPLTTDTNRWAEVIFSSRSKTQIKLMDDSWHWHVTESDPTGSKLTLFANQRKETNFFECSRSGAEKLLLRGSWAGASVAVTLKRLDETNLPLIQSERRWINGFP
jgi:hypothetical protein